MSWMETHPTLWSLFIAMPERDVNFGVSSGESLTEFDVVSVEVEDLGATKNGAVFKVDSPDCWCVVCNNEQLAVSLSKRLLGGLET